jgi:hypothetical protein
MGPSFLRHVTCDSSASGVMTVREDNKEEARAPAAISFSDFEKWKVAGESRGLAVNPLG